MWPFRRTESPSDGRSSHQTTLDLIEQVALLRGQVGSIEIEWANVKDTIRKGYQRMEKSNQRQERRATEDPVVEHVKELEEIDDLHGFARKLKAFRGG